MLEQAEISLDETTRRRLITLLDEDLKHGEGTELMGEILFALMECDRIVLET